MKVLNVNDVLYEVLGEYDTSRENADVIKARLSRTHTDIAMIAPTFNRSDKWLMCRKIDDVEFEYVQTDIYNTEVQND